MKILAYLQYSTIQQQHLCLSDQWRDKTVTVDMAVVWWYYRSGQVLYKAAGKTAKLLVLVQIVLLITVFFVRSVLP